VLEGAEKMFQKVGGRCAVDEDDDGLLDVDFC
jgi:hypothetical protein